MHCITPKFPQSLKITIRYTRIKQNSIKSRAVFKMLFRILMYNEALLFCFFNENCVIYPANISVNKHFRTFFCYSVIIKNVSMKYAML